MDDRIVGYANGILELAKAEGEVERVEDELFGIAQALDKSAELRSSLTDPQLPVERKQAIIAELLGERASALTVGLVQFIISQGRVSDLPDIARALVEKAAESRSRALAEVRSAVPLDENTIARLTAALSKATGKKVEVKVIVDESVIGGIVARVGDTVIDGSIARRMDSLRQALNTR
ncbi:MAG: ATP synthase F1 subunit delta [Actinomycetota bacterium]|nr:ATP synthase F1 subunit delta [Actinomycetota bacterium]